jgi:hypothetical protein
MIARELPLALRLDEQLSKTGICVREDDFYRMYEALGDAAAQHRIRASNPDRTHCRWLKESSSACECLPASVGEQIGRQCPNNPYESKRELIETVAEYRQLISEAVDIADLADLGLLPGPDAITPAEYEAARVMRSYRRMKDMEFQSQLAAASLPHKLLT